MCLCMLVTMMPINMFSYAQEGEEQPEIKIKDAKGVDLELYQLLSYDEAGELQFGADYSPEGETAPSDLEAQIQSIVGTKNVGVDDARIVEILERIGSETGINPSSEQGGDVIYSAIPEGWYILTSSNKDVGLLLEYRNEDIEVSALSIVEWIEAQETAKDVEPKAETKEEPTETVEKKEAEPETKEDSQKEDSKKEKKKTSVKKAAANDATKSNSLEFNEEDIEKFTAEFVKGGEVQRDGSIIWNPQNSNADHRYVYKVTYAFSGVGEIAAGDVEIHVPKRLIKDRDGNYADYYDIAVPSEEEYAKEPDPDVEWLLKESDSDPNVVIIYNRKEISAAEAGTIEVSYLTEKRTFYYEDMSSTDDFTAHLIVKNENTELTADASAPPVIINTYANIISTQKQNPRLYKTWQPFFGERPSDANDYYYIVWTLRTQFNKDTTQPYDLTYEDVFENGDVVGYAFEGERGYNPSGVKENIYQSSKERFDYVLTRHPKSEYAGKNYEVWNNVTATVHPSDGIDEDTSDDSRASYQYRMPTYRRPPGHFYAEKFGQYLSTYSTSTTEYGDGSAGIVHDSEDISDFTLTEFKEGDVDVIDNPRLKYYTFLRGYAYPWTIDEGDSLNDPTSFGKNPVTYSFEDETLCIDGQEKLGPGDYEISKLTMSYDFSSAVFDEEELYFVEHKGSKAGLTSDNDLVLYAKKAGDADWVAVAKYSFIRDRFYDVNNDYVKYTYNKDVHFNSGILGYKWTASNAMYYTCISTYPTVKLFRTEKVLNDIGDKTKIGLENTGYVSVTDYQGNELFPRDAMNSDDELFSECGVHNIDFIAGVIRESYIEKKQVGARPNKAKKIYTVSWRIDMKERYEDNDGQHYTVQEGGKFYDLCPVGSHADLNSIEVFREGRTRLNKNEYSVELISNWRKTGRDMVVITITKPGDYYSFNIDTIHEWEDLNDTTFDVLNSVAYETGNDKIAEGYADNGGTGADKVLLTDLDPDSDAVKFIYSQDKHYIDLVTSTSTGLTKKVRAKEDEKYSYSTFTTIDGEYYYKIRLANNGATRTKGIIFFDSLENYSNNEVSPDWRGTLQGVDVSNLEDAGINPVVYYSSIENLDIYAHNNLDEEINGEKVWQTEEEFGDITNAKAVAIDCRKTTDGEDFVLAGSQSLQARLKMKAPSEDANIGRIRYAYNNIFMHAIEINEFDEEHEDLIRHDYTKIGYKITGSNEFLKVDEKDHTNKIEGIKFHVTGTSAYGTSVDEECVSDADGIVHIPTLEMGTYEIRELKSSDDWLVDRTVYHATVNGRGEMVFDLPKEGESYYWENEERVHSKLTLKKRSNETVTGVHSIPDTEFTLQGTSDYGTTVVKKGVTGADGILKFDDIEKGTYSLLETGTNPEYIPNDTVYTVIVDEAGVCSIKNGEHAGNYYIIENTKRYHDFDIRKVDPKDRSLQLEGAEFTLTGRSNIGTEYVDVKGVTDDRGFVSFERIEAGTYVIQETKAPNRYLLDPMKRTVTIDDAGHVTIEGLDVDGNYFVWPNERSLDGKIVVTKVWDDNKTNDERPIPKVHLYTKDKLLAETQAYAVLNQATGVLSFFRDTPGKYTNNQQIGSKTYYTGFETDPNYDASYNWGGFSRTIRKVRFEDIIRPLSMKYWFAHLTIPPVDLSKIDTSGLTDMSYMFYDSSVSSIDFGDHFDTSHVEHMESMCQSCPNLQSIDISGFDTRNVTSARYLFANCSALRSVNMYGTDWSSLNDSQEPYWFQQSRNIRHIDLADAVMPKNCSYLFQNLGQERDPLHLNTDNTDWSNVQSHGGIFGYSHYSNLYVKDLAINDPSTEAYYSGNTWYMGYDVHVLGDVVLDNPNMLGFGGQYGFGNMVSDEQGTVIFANCSLPETIGSMFMGNSNTYNYSDIIFYNVDASATKSFDGFYYKPGGSIDLRGVYNTQNIEHMDTFARGYVSSSYYKPVWLIFGDQFDTSNVVSWSSFLNYGNAHDEQMSVYFGHDNFKLDNPDSNYSSFLSYARATTIYSDISESVELEDNKAKWILNYNDFLVGQEGTREATSDSSPLYKGSKDLYKFYKVDGGPDDPGLLTATSEADLPPSPAVRYTEALANIREEWSVEFAGFSHKDYMTPLPSASGSDLVSGDDIVTEDDKWVKNDDGTWTYTFDVFDDEEEYYMYEESMPGYSASYSGAINGDGLITKSGTIENVSTETGDIALYKSISGGNNADHIRDFDVVVELRTADSSLVEGVKQFGDVVFVNGRAVVKINEANRPAIIIPDIPTYYRVTVTETVPSMFDVTSMSVVCNNSLVAEGVDGSATFTTNALYPTNVYLTNTRNTPSTSSFSVSKRVERGVGSSSYPMEVNISGLEPNITYSYSGSTSGSYSADNLGNAQVTLNMRSGYRVTFGGVPVTTKYSVEEAANELTASYDVVTNTAGAEVVSKHDQNSAPQQALSTAVESVGTSVTFINRGPEESDEVTDIKLIKKNRADGSVLSDATYRFEGTTSIGDQISITQTSDSNGEIVFKEIPDGDYTLREIQAPDGFALDPTIRTVKVVNGHPMHYATDVQIETKGFSHTPNVSDDGTKNGNYVGNLNTNDVVTIPGANLLQVDLYYNGEGISWDWLSVWKGNYPNYTASNNRTSEGAVTRADGAYNNDNKFGGYYTGSSYMVNGHLINNIGHSTLKFEGDTVTFGFKSDEGGYGAGYGYYAIVTGFTGPDLRDYDMHELSIQGLSKDTFGRFVLNDSPKNMGIFEIEKVSSVDHDNKLYGAYFTLLDSDNNVVSRKGSDRNGIVKFTNLDPGTYTLKETDAPTGYQKSDKVYTVTVDADNTVMISDPTGSALEPIDGKYQIENTPQPVDLNIKKTVVGAMGDKNKDFDFTVHVEKTLPGDYVIEKSGGESETVTVGSNGIADIPVSVKHNQTATIKGLSYNAEVVVTEPSSEYFAGYTVTTGTRVINSRSNQEANTELSTQEIILDGDYTVEYMNSLDGVVPTGMEQTKKNLMILFFALSIIFVAILRKIRKDASAK